MLITVNFQKHFINSSLVSIHKNLSVDIVPWESIGKNECDSIICLFEAPVELDYIFYLMTANLCCIEIIAKHDLKLIFNL